MEGNRRSVMSVPPPPTSLSLSLTLICTVERVWLSGSVTLHTPMMTETLINRLHYVIFICMVVSLNLSLSTYEPL